MSSLTSCSGLLTNSIWWLPDFAYAPWASEQLRTFKKGTILSPKSGCFVDTFYSHFER